LKAIKIAFEDVGADPKKIKTEVAAKSSSGSELPADSTATGVAAPVKMETALPAPSAPSTLTPTTPAAPSAENFDAWARRFSTSAKDAAKRTTSSSNEEPGTESQKLSSEDPMVAATSRDDVSRPEDLCIHGAYWDEDGALLDQDMVQQGMMREKRLMEELDVKTEVRRDQLPKGTRIWTCRWCHRL
jgi:hypothetical protein